MILYHGSNIEIEKPDLSKSKPYKDFGRGFYLSDNEHQACRMAELRTSMMRCGTPVVTRFEFDERTLEGHELQCMLFKDYYIPPHSEFIFGSFRMKGMVCRKECVPLQHDYTGQIRRTAPTGREGAGHGGEDTEGL